MRAGFDIKAGYDIDARCKYAFESNNRAKFYARNLKELEPEEIRKHYSGNSPSVLAGCAPCQPFSTYKHRYAEDAQWELVSKFAELAIGVQPDFVTMENVPALVNYKQGTVFKAFCAQLEEDGFNVDWAIAKCEDFGVPQKRRRLVLVASKLAIPKALTPTHQHPVSVRDAIGALPSLEAGQSDPNDKLHVSSHLTAINLKRIRNSKPGGTWRDWPEALRAACHQRDTGKTYPGVYARMSWDEPSPTMTTQCFGYGNGRFGHPEQDRAISLREAALLQSFPKDYEFLAAGERLSFTEIGRWIGNAVPVFLAEAIGTAIAATHQEVVT